MKVLLDHCMPTAFGHLLVGHEVRTSRSMKWEDLENGDLLSAASRAFGAFVTVDANMRKQQNFGALPLPLLALVAPSNTVEDLAPLATETVSVLGSKLQNRVYIIGPLRKPRSGSR